MRVIFLDIDGVLVNLESIKATETEHKAARTCVAVLNRLLDESGAQIVISSTWRAMGFNRLRMQLIEWGVKGEILGFTPDLSTQYQGLWLSPSRASEIQAWLDGFPAESGQTIDGYVILDDDLIEGFEDCQVQTEFTHGLQLSDIERAIMILETQ